MRRVLVRVWMLAVPTCGSTTVFSSPGRHLRPAPEYIQRRTAHEVFAGVARLGV